MNVASSVMTLAAFCLCLAATSASAVTVDWVTIGNPGNANDATGYGSANYSYKIGKYEVTIGQYAEFLNAAAKTDRYGLYAPRMGTVGEIAGIARSGTSGAYSYSVIGPFATVQIPQATAAERPIQIENWFNAARFANWMQNGQGTGDTETGAYTLVGGQMGGTAPAKNPGAQFYIPTDDEWYKAAYYSPVKGGAGKPGYYKYATQSDAAPGNTVGSASNQANYGKDGMFSVGAGSRNLLTNVGAFSGSRSFYGTFDQSGNAWEWTDLTGVASVNRGLRGGGIFFFGDSAYSFNVVSASINISDDAMGFRLAAPVPEPSTYAMAVAGLACGGYSMFRRRKRD